MKAKGFTLIELVIVIVIVGIMAAVALPRYVDLSQDSHDSVSKAAFSSFESAVMLYHSCWLVSSNQGYVENLACYGDGDIDSTITGYPLGQNTGGDGSKLEGSYCAELWTGLLAEDFKIAPHADSSFIKGNDIVYWFSATDATNPETHCYYNYISDNPEKGQENWQMRYYPATGKVIVGRATLS